MQGRWHDPGNVIYWEAMRNRLMHAAFLLLTCALLPAHPLSGLYTYHTTAGDRSWEVRYRVVEDGGRLDIEVESTESRWEAVHAGTSTLLWRYEAGDLRITTQWDPKRRVLHYLREQDTEREEKTHTLKKDLPFIQVFEFGLIPFITASSQERFTFYALRPATGEVYEMEARKQGEETLTVMGKEVRALKVTIRLAGLLSAFWKSTYWFDPATGVMLRFEGTLSAGGPFLTRHLTGMAPVSLTPEG
ncbi:hypothetical protein STHERM_c14280 [Spirochaeta thermophila DSM 6192]|uniref:DUF3108 domain-containing protein n=2 Tax=Winmispira thermophila TaxID=154 RepID=E0RT72_WINT6|nr:hypothetical protein STHERM_c14280 [Spirochaeta thermophila DSM 6192]